MRLSKAEMRLLEQYWKLGTCSVREVLESLRPRLAVSSYFRCRWVFLGADV
jgi:predicted transcriptional regulator